jgi:ParB-like chromosome segregation protein Spo0J
MASDLEHPIHLVEHKGRFVVLDGYHRVLKAAIEGRTEIAAIVLSQRDLASVCEP